MYFVFSGGSKPSRRRWFLNNNHLFYQWSHIAAWSQLQPLTDHRSGVASSGRTPRLLLEKKKQKLQSTIDCVEVSLLCSQRTGFCFSEHIFLDAQQCWPRSGFSRRCGSKVKSRSMCAEVRPSSCLGLLKPTEIFRKSKVWEWFWNSARWRKYKPVSLIQKLMTRRSSNSKDYRNSKMFKKVFSLIMDAKFRGWV